MLARSIFELAVEIRLILRNPDAAEKISVFTDLEKHRSAKQILKFPAMHPSYQVPANERRLMAEQDRLWTGLKKHWSGLMDLAAERNLSATRLTRCTK
jgi:hypothetical protein